ncbi:hypothetical protein GpartN1_g6787.t1 [Galdieria partita]|uniref:Uncharacterized protein n=1 Tax=Galdieria partita TaxID=83374 RepID=A0A9C7UTE3_9RHOD|nr:hypothetical protein GpartN1_g6787.t1 [Galdieria partita]
MLSEKSKGVGRNPSSLIKKLLHRELATVEEPTIQKYAFASLRSDLENLQAYRNHSLHFYTDTADILIPVFSTKFSKLACNGQALACVDEEGYLTVVDTRKWLQTTPKETDTRAYRLDEWREPTTWRNKAALSTMIHQNAIFDVCWLGTTDQQIATASGDQTIRITDTTTWGQVSNLTGHRGSVKVVREMPLSDGKILGSAGRDGNVMLWDIRCPGKNTFLGQTCSISPVLSLQQIHSPSYASPMQERVTKRRRTSNALGMRPQNEASTSYGVTGLAFHPQSDGHLLFTSGAVDGSVKLWDVRKVSSSSQEIEILATCHPGCDEELTSRPHGISSIQMDIHGRYLLACSTDSRVYLYDPSRIEWGACTILTGGQNMSFYVKCDFSPDGNFVVTGSCNSRAYIWDLSICQSTQSCIYPFLELEGHQGEVSDVAWCRTEPELIATSGDDCMVSLWHGPKLRNTLRASNCTTNSVISATRLDWTNSIKVDTPSRKRNRREGDNSRTPLQLKSITEYFNRVNPSSSEKKDHK